MERCNLERCNDHGITLNGDKFVFGIDLVEFCGYQVSADGSGHEEDEGDRRVPAAWMRHVPQIVHGSPTSARHVLSRDPCDC